MKDTKRLAKQPAFTLLHLVVTASVECLFSSSTAEFLIETRFLYAGNEK